MIKASYIEEQIFIYFRDSRQDIQAIMKIVTIRETVNSISFQLTLVAIFEQQIVAPCDSYSCLT